MKCTVTINMDNDAFSEAPEYELGRILAELAKELQHYSGTPTAGDVLPLRDAYGNRVGEYRID